MRHPPPLYAKGRLELADIAIVAIVGARQPAPCPAANELAAADEHRPPEPLPNIARRTQLIVSALGPSPVDIDELIRATGVATRKVHIVLLELDLAGRLQRHGQHLVSLDRSRSQPLFVFSLLASSKATL